MQHPDHKILNKNPNQLSVLKNDEDDKIQFSHLSLECQCDQMINVALRQVLAQPVTPVTHRQSNHTSILHLLDTVLPVLPREEHFPHLFLFPPRVTRAWIGDSFGLKMC